MKVKITAAIAAQTNSGAKPIELFDSEVQGLILRIEPSGAKTFYCAYRLRPSGKRGRYRIGRFPAMTPGTARDEARKILGDAARGSDPMAAVRDARQAAKAHTLRTFLKEVYAPWAQSHYTNAGATLARLDTVFQALLDTKLSELAPFRIERWKAERQKTTGAHKRPLSPNTINRDLTDLRAALNRAVEWGHLAESPLRRVKQVKAPFEPLVRYLKEHEEAALRHALAERDTEARAARERFNTWRTNRHLPVLVVLPAPYSDHLTPMVLLSINTGLRRGELFSLRWGDIDLDRRNLTVRASNAKSRKVRHIPLNDEAIEVLEAWKKCAPATDGLVFPAKDGERFDNVDSAYESVLKSAGISPFRWHDLRHHFASRLVMAGVDLNTVRELLGHADLKMTLRYAHLAPEHKAQAVARLRSAR